jgi:IS1 family transposase
LVVANVLKHEKQVAVLNTLLEGASVRSVERLTGVHRDTILRLMVKVGNGCDTLLNEAMRGLSCERIECDELWAFVGKKQRHVTAFDDPAKGDIWTYIAIDSDTKLVPTFMSGKRTDAATTAFISDLRGRLNKRVQITTDGLRMYATAIADSFGTDGSECSYATLVKQFEAEPLGPGRYSPPKVTGTAKTPIFGSPVEELISTSYVERKNLSLRMGVRRFTRLTNAHSKKVENHVAMVALWFAFYNFVRPHSTVRTTPAVAAGVTDHEWTLAELMDAASNMNRVRAT